MKSIDDIEHLLQRYKYPYRSWLPGEINDLYEVYNNLFEKKEATPTCYDCVEEVYKKLYMYYIEKKK